MSNWNSKRECRSYFRSLFAQELAQGIVQNQKQFDARLQSFLGTQSGTWGAYRALSGELSVEVVFEVSQLDWVFPKVVGQEMIFLRPDGFVTGAFGIQEPSDLSEPVSLSVVRGLLVPGLAFNRNGNRLGRGKGFYDKTLSFYEGVKVGVCFDFQISSDPLPIESHDLQMEYLLTESGLIDCRKYRE